MWDDSTIPNAAKGVEVDGLVLGKQVAHDGVFGLSC